MDPPQILLISEKPHPPLVSRNFATRGSSPSIPEQPGHSLVEHHTDCGIDCLQLASSSTAAPLQSRIEENLNCTMDFACVDGGNLVKMISAQDKEIEIHRENEHALEHRYIAEHAERFASIYKNPILRVSSPMEEQAATVYTRNIFNKFQDELLESLKLKKGKLEKSGSFTLYKVSNFQTPHKVFLVTLDVESLDASCQCHLFEFKGILCCHILAIFHKKDVEKIPSRYILPRWTKGAAEGIPIPIFKKDGDAIARDLRFNNTISRLRPYLHVSGKAFDTIIEALDMTLEKVSKMQESKKEIPIEVAIEENAKDACHLLVGDPHISKTKGRKKESVKESKRGRLRSGFEVGIERSKRLKRRYKDCREFGHYSATCERRKQTIDKNNSKVISIDGCKDVPQNDEKALKKAVAGGD